MGTALLRGYRFQINERGYANAIQSPADVVAGLCYLLTSNDEARLDINEGVAIGAYEKEWLDVEFFTAEAALVGRKVVETIAHDLALESFERRQREGTKGAVTGERMPALVYASQYYAEEGEPREEYVDRMNLGIADALMLGVSKEYIDTCIRKYIPDRPIGE